MNQNPSAGPGSVLCRLGTGGRRCVRRLRRYGPCALVRAGLVLSGAAVVTVVLVAVPVVAWAAEPSPASPAGQESIQRVAENIRVWLVGILVTVATLFLTVGGLRYLAANGDPGEVEKAKLALRSAVIGYALALLAPLFVTIVGGWVA